MNNRRSFKKIVCILVLILTCALCPDFKTWAEVPPPPVNQFIGIVDSILQNPIASDCRVCHESGLPDRHHLLVGSVIPEPTSAPYGTPGLSYECLSCHGEDTSSGNIVFLVERDCLVCHLYDPDSRPSAPHHNTQDAIDRHCSECHGSVVQDFDDDHYIPDYDISAVTPDPDCKTWDGPICVSGGCSVCHVADDTALPLIAANQELHHSVRFDCSFCHNAHGNIRDCEACHGPDALHNIQADSDNPYNIGLIIPGEEDLGWGHIGNGWDCFGCHESFTGAGTAGNSLMLSASESSVTFSASNTPQTAATIPSISSMSIHSVTAGIDTQLDIYGSGFINETGGVTFESEIVVENGVDALILERHSITVNSISVTVPSTLTAGSYELRVVKGDKLSNKEILAVIPAVVITDVACDMKKGVLTVNGSGFGEKPAGTDAYINAQLDGQTVDITSWADTLINASVSSCRSKPTVIVNALMGSAVYSVGAGGGKPDKPCKGKTCT